METSKYMSEWSTSSSALSENTEKKDCAEALKRGLSKVKFGSGGKICRGAREKIEIENLKSL